MFICQKPQQQQDSNNTAKLPENQGNQLQQKTNILMNINNFLQYSPRNIVQVDSIQVRVCDAKMENSKQIETCLSEISDNKDMILSLEKLQDSDNSATTIPPCTTEHRVQAQIKNISGKKSDKNELE